MSEAPRVSVLMSVHNGARYVRQAVDSILAQTFTDFEFIIVDDASTDETPALLAQLQDPRLVRLRNDVNLGLTASLNLGLAVARGEIIVRQDADDVSWPERIARQVAVLDARPGVQAVFCGCRLIDADGQVLQATPIWLSPEAIYLELFFNNCLAHGAACLSRALLQAVGGYAEALAYAQDYELWNRLKARTPLVMLDAALYDLRLHPASASQARQAEQAAAFRRILRANLDGLGLPQAAADPEVLEAVRALQPVTLSRRQKNQADFIAQTALARIQQTAPAFLDPVELRRVSAAYRQRFEARVQVPQAERLTPERARLELERLAEAHRRAQTAELAALRGRAITIVMLSWNRLEETRRAVRALSQNVSLPFRLVLVDNASDGDVPQALAELARQYPFIELKLLRENLGCGGGRQYALDFVETEWVLFLDNDIEVLPGSVEALALTLARQPDLVAAAANVVFPSGRVHMCGADYTRRDGVLHYELLAHGLDFDHPGLGSSGPCRWVNAGATLFRAAALRAHPYDPALHGYYEDFEWCYRLNQLGLGFYHRVVEARVVHHHEAKIGLPAASGAGARQRAMPFIEAIAALHAKHGFVLQNLFDFVPELAGLEAERRRPSAERFLELVQTCGSGPVLAWWQSGELAALLEGRAFGPDAWQALLDRLGVRHAGRRSRHKELRMTLEKTDPVTLPFDQYQRYRLIQEVIDNLRWRTPLRVLDVGGSPATLLRFLPQDQVIVTDVADQGGLHLFASGLALPFPDRAFDVVVSSDVLEHVPAPSRPTFLAELGRVAGELIVLGAPFDHPAVVAAEAVLRRLIEAQYGQGYHFLDEHLHNGLPDLSATEAALRDGLGAVVTLPNGYLHRWLPALTTFFFLQWRFADPELNARANRYYNENFYRADNAEPAYRHTLVAARTRDLSGLPGRLCPETSAAPAASEAQWAALGALIQSLGATQLTRLQNELTRLQTELTEHMSRLGARETELRDARQRLAEQEKALQAAQRLAAEQAQVLRAIQASRAYRLVSGYWRLSDGPKRRVRALYSALRARLREVIPYAWRHRAVTLYRGWREARTPAASVSVEARRPISFPPQRRYDLICFPLIDWEFRFQRPQHLLSEFARAGHRVFYLRTGFRGPGSQAEVESIAERIYGVSLPGPRHLNLYRDSLTPAVQETLLAALSGLRQQTGIVEAVCLVQLPFWASLAQAARERWGWRLVYDCMDEHSGFSDVSETMLAAEASLMAQSDLVVTTARRLHEKALKTARRTALIPNAADFEHFNRDPQTAPLAHLPRPIIGYYGAIADWFDVEMVRDAARARPGWQFVLIGSTYLADVTPLQALPNVHLLGEKPYADLPGYLHQFDVACIPFKLSPLTEATNPVKFYEYLSAGKPIVAVELPELQPYSGYFLPVRRREDFVRQVEAALSTRTPEAIQARVELARQNTWPIRQAALEAAIADAYPKVSVVLDTGGAPDPARLRRVLERLWSESLYPVFEVVIWEAGLSGEAVGVLRAEAAREPRLKLAPAGSGPDGAGRWSLTELGDLVVVMSADLLVTAGWLSRLVFYLGNLQVGLVSPAVRAGPPPLAASGVPAPEARCRDLEAVPPCLGVRRALLEELDLAALVRPGGLEARDDLARRVRRAGYAVIGADDVTVLADAAADAQTPGVSAVSRPFRRDRIVWRCNICGQACDTTLEQLGRETPACPSCRSTVRMRAIIHLLSVELFGESLLLADFPRRPDLRGIGLSDWEVYAAPLAQKLNYTNTYYHKEPRLDIATPALDPALEGTLDFLISTDVFEHVAPPVDVAFDNVARLLKPGGLFVFSVPYGLGGSTREHFPELFEYEIVREGERRRLRNRTRDGREQVFESLVFHGGEGETLEMRFFAEADLLAALARVGLGSVKIFRQPYLAHGIYWHHPWSLPLTARRVQAGATTV